MGVTFAANGIYLGMAAGLLAGVSTHSAAVGIVVAIGASAGAWYGIRGFEKLLGRGVSAGFTAVQNRANQPPPTGRYQPPPQYGPPQPYGQMPPQGYGYSPSSYPPAPQPPVAQPNWPALEGHQPWG